jgi:glycosyltransferase involved in cell wall biosynthesis
VTAISTETMLPDGISPASRGHAEVFLMANTLETGGSERQFAVLARGLQTSNLSIRLGCLSNKGIFRDELNGIVEFPPGGSLLGLQSQRARLALSRYFRRHRVAVANSFDFYSNLMLIPAAGLAGVHVVIGSHRQLGDLMSWPQFWAQCCVFQFCDRVICNSRAAADYLHERGRIPRSKLAVIPNGLPEAAFLEVEPALPRATGALRMGMIARMNDPGKNHASFIRVAAKIAKRYPQVEFVFVGDGSLRAGLEETARALGLGKRLVFLGERRDIPAILAALDVSILTSVSESLSNVIMESMAGGVPVVAARVGGNPELVQDGETGMLVPPEDDEALATALEKLLDNGDLRRALGARAKSVAKSKFGLLNVCRQYEDLYRELLSEKGCSQAASSRP